MSAKGVALCFEGGGMKAAFSAAYSKAILKANLSFDCICGVSAGSSIALNHASYDWKRSYYQFVDRVEDPRFGGFSHFLRGHGYFNSDYLYEGCVDNGDVPFDFEAYKNNPADVIFSAFGAKTGKTYVWHQRDVGTVTNLMHYCRGSSTLPFVMRPYVLQGDPLYDGALGSATTAVAPLAWEAGYDRIVCIFLHPRNYNGGHKSALLQLLIKIRFGRYPHLVRAFASLAKHYQAVRQEIFRREKEGKALVITPPALPARTETLNREKLLATWQLGVESAAQNIERIRAFVEAS